MTFVSFFWQVKLKDPSSWPSFPWCTAWLKICSKLASCLLKQSMPLRRCIASIQQPSRGLVWHIYQQDNLLGILLVVSHSCSPSASFHWIDAEIYQDDQMIFSKSSDTNQLNHICSWNGQQRCADLIPFFVEFQLCIQNPCYCFGEPLCHPINPKIYSIDKETKAASFWVVGQHFKMCAHQGREGKIYCQGIIAEFRAMCRLRIAYTIESL